MIHPINWTRKQSKATLGALRSIATLHGTAPIAEQERELIEGIRINILRYAEGPEDEPAGRVRPADLAEILEDDDHRDRAAQLIALMPFAVRPYAGSKTYIVEKYLDSLGKSMHALEDFIGARQKHNRSMTYCALRKLGRDIFPKLDASEIDQELLDLIANAQGNPAEHERYQSLEGYPKGSLGRAFWDFYAQFDWPLPGDPLWISEDLTVRHDLVHVLCDYDVSINGEFRVSAFAAGNSEQFNWMIAMLGFTPPYVSTGEQFRARDFFDAYFRGVNASQSFVDHWDFWSVMEHPVEDLRRTYLISNSKPWSQNQSQPLREARTGRLSPEEEAERIDNTFQVLPDVGPAPAEMPREGETKTA